MEFILPQLLLRTFLSQSNMSVVMLRGVSEKNSDKITIIDWSIRCLVVPGNGFQDIN